MNNLARKTEVAYNVFYKKKKWLLNLYIIKSNADEIISDEEVSEIINKSIEDIEQNCISKEFIYFRTGFAFLHYGNRGIDLNIWHVGKWGNTYEIFKRVWYCYKRDYTKMEVLDDAEPVISQYEIMLLNNEFSVIADIIKELSDKDSFREEYIKSQC